MNEKAVKVGLVLLGAAWVKAYGEYKYYRGKVDANKVNKVFIDIQQGVIEVLQKHIDNLEKGKA